MFPASSRQPLRNLENASFVVPRTKTKQWKEKETRFRPAVGVVGEDPRSLVIIPSSRSRQPFRSVGNRHAPRQAQKASNQYNRAIRIYESPAPAEQKTTAPRIVQTKKKKERKEENETRFRKVGLGGDPLKLKRTPKTSSSHPLRNIGNSYDSRPAHNKASDHINRLIKIYESPPEKKITPIEDFLQRFKTVVSSRYPYGTGYIDIRGAIQEGDSEWRNDLDLDEVSFTKAQVRRIRVLILPMERCRAMDDMGILILGEEEFHRRNKEYTTGFSYSVLRSYLTLKRIYSQTEKDIPKRFNLLFGFTYHLYRNPRWMTHHGRDLGGENILTGLALWWKDLLKQSAQELALDLEFSYPAVMHFVEDFKKSVESVEKYGDPRLRFEYK
jgi:hypothetical protein